MPPKSIIVCKHMLTIRTAQKTQQGGPWAQSLRGGGEAREGLEVKLSGIFRMGSCRVYLRPPAPPPLPQSKEKNIWPMNPSVMSP